MGAGSSQRTAQAASRGSKKAGRQGKPGEKISRKQQAENTRRKLADTALRLLRQQGLRPGGRGRYLPRGGRLQGYLLRALRVEGPGAGGGVPGARPFLSRFPPGDRQDSGTGVERLLAFGRYSLRHISSLGKDYLKVAYSSQMAPGRGPSPLASEERASHEIALRLVREAQEDGELRSDFPAEEIALVLVRAIRGLVIDWCLLDGGFDLVQAGEPLLEIMLDGLKPREDESR